MTKKLPATKLPTKKIPAVGRIDNNKDAFASMTDEHGRTVDEALEAPMEGEVEEVVLEVRSRIFEGLAAAVMPYTPRGEMLRPAEGRRDNLTSLQHFIFALAHRANELGYSAAEFEEHVGEAAFERFAGRIVRALDPLDGLALRGELDRCERPLPGPFGVSGPESFAKRSPTTKEKSTMKKHQPTLQETIDTVREGSKLRWNTFQRKVEVELKSGGWQEFEAHHITRAKLTFENPPSTGMLREAINYVAHETPHTPEPSELAQDFGDETLADVEKVADQIQEHQRSTAAILTMLGIPTIKLAGGRPAGVVAQVIAVLKLNFELHDRGQGKEPRKVWQRRCELGKTPNAQVTPEPLPALPPSMKRQAPAKKKPVSRFPDPENDSDATRASLDNVAAAMARLQGAPAE